MVRKSVTTFSYSANRAERPLRMSIDSMTSDRRPAPSPDLDSMRTTRFPSRPRSARSPTTLALTLALTLTLCACVTSRVGVESSESFDAAATFSRTYAAVDVQTCEAARRTLLSQGYVIGVATAELVRGRKSFQSAPETHVEVEIVVVCARDGYKGKRTIAFVNAVQDNFALKKSNNSASLGLPAFGAISLPFTGSDESLIKVASVTIENPRFYDRFFRLLERYLEGDPGQLIPPGLVLDPPETMPAAARAAVPAGPASGAAPASAAVPASARQ